MTAAYPSFGQRIPPHNFEAEQALLGAILLSNRAFERVSEFLKPEHFADPVHGRIFAACGKLIERGQMANPVTLKTYFEADGGLTEIGGTPYLAQLANSVVSVINAEDYGKLVFDLHQRRELIGLGEDLVNTAYSPDLDRSAEDIRGDHERALIALDTGNSGNDAVGAEVVGGEFIAEMERACKSGGAGLLTGLNDFDRMAGGLHDSDLVILAGRPSMGKSAISVSIMRRLAMRGIHVAFFSLEMSRTQVFARMAAEEVGISFSRFREGQLSPAEQLQVTEGAMALQRLPLFIDDQPGLTVSALMARARRLRRKHKVAVVIIDYLQLLRGSTAYAGNRVQEVSEITRCLKVLAKDLSVPVIALSQLSRAVEQREDKRPQLSDLRESGSIEQDADAVMFCFREQYYLERAEPAQRPDEDLSKFNERHSRWLARMGEVANTVDVIVAKQRHGPVGTVRLAYFPGTNTVSDLAQGGA